MALVSIKIIIIMNNNNANFNVLYPGQARSLTIHDIITLTEMYFRCCYKALLAIIQVHTFLRSQLNNSHKWYIVIRVDNGTEKQQYQFLKEILQNHFMPVLNRNSKERFGNDARYIYLLSRGHRIWTPSSSLHTPGSSPPTSPLRSSSSSLPQHLVTEK